MFGFPPYTQEELAARGWPGAENEAEASMGEMAGAHPPVAASEQTRQASAPLLEQAPDPYPEISEEE